MAASHDERGSISLNPRSSMNLFALHQPQRGQISRKLRHSNFFSRDQRSSTLNPLEFSVAIGCIQNRQGPSRSPSPKSIVDELNCQILITGFAPRIPPNAAKVSGGHRTIGRCLSARPQGWPPISDAASPLQLLAATETQLVHPPETGDPRTFSTEPLIQSV